MKKYIAEFVGTLIFLLVILHVTQEKANWKELTPLLIAVGLLAGIAISAGVSGAHLNPAVSTMMALKGSLSTVDYLPYVGAQLLGGATAYYVYSQLN